jgi:hypothetical protein
VRKAVAVRAGEGKGAVEGKRVDVWGRRAMKEKRKAGSGEGQKAENLVEG